MSRGATALAGVAAGAVVGLVLLTTTHPTSAYTNDAYRSGASFGYVLRYVVLGLVAALLIRALRGGRPARRPLYGLALAVVVGLAIIPPALDTETSSEKRKREAVAIDDPKQRREAELRAGAIDGCTEETRRQLESVPPSERFDPEAYCECFIAGVTAGPADDEAQLEAMAETLRSGERPRRFVRLGERCAQQAA